MVLLGGLVWVKAQAAKKEFVPVAYVNPFIGTQGLGNTFPGAAIPFGLVKLGPDCDDISSNMGYRHDGRVKGFSHLHESGTGVICEDLCIADPTIFRDTDGTYYLYGTSPDSNKGFEVYRSGDLETWEGPVGALASGFVLTPQTSWGTKGFWAPQVFLHDGKYYMVYTANEQLAVATADSPCGPFVQADKQMMPAAMKQIDPFVFFDTDGKAYLYHVRLTEGNRIFVAELNPDLKSVKEETARECVHAESGWEDTWNAEWSVTEGPTVIRQGNTYYLFYSANDFRNPDYAVGYATASSPLGPWTKQGVLISRNNMGMNGTGHGDLFRTDDGSWQYVLHVHHSAGQPTPRHTAIVTLHEKDGQFVAEPSTLRMLRK